MPSCLSGWPGKYKSSSVFYSPLPQISVKYSTLWAWFLNFFTQSGYKENCEFSAKSLLFIVGVFCTAPLFHIWSWNIQMPYLFSYCLDFLIENLHCFFLHWFLSRHRVLHIPFAKNLGKLLTFVLQHIHATVSLCCTIYTNTDKGPHLNNPNTIYGLIFFSLFTAREHYN